MSRRHRPEGRPAGFTLVELLVVIGIIALLISILLPALGATRRQANNVKCSAALNQVYKAFKLYESETKGWWPIPVYKVNGPAPAAGQVDTRERRWSDMLSKYLHKTAGQGADDIVQFRQNSVLWGCPEFTKSIELDTTVFADRVRNGYGMQYYPMSPAAVVPGSVAFPGNLAYIDIPAGSVGRWYKANVWLRKGTNSSASRGLIADSGTHIINGSETYSRSTGGFQNGTFSGTQILYVPAGATLTVGVDAQRHLKPGRPVRELRNGKGTNMLFCDGSVRAVTPAEAWCAIRADGLNKTVP